MIDIGKILGVRLFSGCAILRIRASVSRSMHSIFQASPILAPVSFSVCIELPFGVILLRLAGLFPLLGV